MTKRTTEQLLRELLYLASPESSEEGRATAARAIARRGDEALPEGEADELAEGLRPAEPDGDGHEHVNLRGADLAHANLYQVRLRGADLHGADLRGADLAFSDLRAAELGTALLTGADLRGVDLSGARLGRCELDEAVLDDAELVSVDLRGARLVSASLRGVDLTDADLRGADLSGADLSGARLWRARLAFAELGNCDLSDTDLETAVGPLSVDGLRGARWSDGTRWPLSQPGLSEQIQERSVGVAPGVYQVRDDESRDRRPDLAPGPYRPTPVR